MPSKNTHDPLHDPLLEAQNLLPGPLKRFFARLDSKPRPLQHIQVEVTSFCPGACAYCPRGILHSAWQGLTLRRIRVTGGASRSPLLRRIIADVFQAEVETVAVSNSAGLGAALRAANAVDGVAFPELFRRFCRPVETLPADPSAVPRYDRMLAKYREFERSVK